MLLQTTDLAMFESHESLRTHWIKHEPNKHVIERKINDQS